MLKQGEKLKQDQKEKEANVLMAHWFYLLLCSLYQILDTVDVGLFTSMISCSHPPSQVARVLEDIASATLSSFLCQQYFLVYWIIPISLPIHSN